MKIGEDAGVPDAADNGLGEKVTTQRLAGGGETDERAGDGERGDLEEEIRRNVLWVPGADRSAIINL